MSELRMQRAATAALTANLVASDDSRRRLDHAACVMRMNDHTETAELLDLIAQMGGHYADQGREIEEALS